MSGRRRGPPFFRRVRVLAHAEVLHVARDRASLVQIILLPMIQLLLLSNVATFAIKRSPAYIVDFDRTSTSRGVVSRLRSSGYFDIVGQSASPDSANRAMLGGKATLVVTIPHDFDRTLVRTGTAPIGLDVNAEKGSAAGIVQSYALAILSDYSRELSADLRPTIHTVSDEPLETRPPQPEVPRIEVRTQSLYNPTLNYKHY
ncbi:MAG TPA: ABC transporter permease, partial [Gemmatimonadaceae bacterium]